MLAARVAAGFGDLAPVRQARPSPRSFFSAAVLGYPLYAAVSIGSVAIIIVIRRESVTQERADRVADPLDGLSREPVSTRPAGHFRRMESRGRTCVGSPNGVSPPASADRQTDDCLVRDWLAQAVRLTSPRSGETPP
jgi:hypothetical protein